MFVIEARQMTSTPQPQTTKVFYPRKSENARLMVFDWSDAMAKPETPGEYEMSAVFRDSPDDEWERGALRDYLDLDLDYELAFESDSDDLGFL